MSDDAYGPGGIYGPGYSPMDPMNVSNDVVRPNAFSDASSNPGERAAGREVGFDVADVGGIVYDQHHQRGGAPEAHAYTGGGSDYNRYPSGSGYAPPASEAQNLYYRTTTDGRTHAYKDKGCHEEVSNPTRKETMLDALARENPETLKALFDKMVKNNPNANVSEYDPTKNYADLRAKEGTYLTQEEEALLKPDINKVNQDVLRQKTADTLRDVIARKEKSEMTSEEAEKATSLALMQLAKSYSNNNSK